MRKMRFAYLDGEGREVRLSGAEAVKAGIRHGTIGPETLLFDAEAGGWSRAECHPFYQEVLDESPDEPGEGPAVVGPSDAEDPPIQELWRFPARFDDEGDGQTATPDPARSEEEPDPDVELERMDLKLSLLQGRADSVQDPPRGEEPPESEARGSDEGAPSPRMIPGGDHLVLDLGEEDDDPVEPPQAEEPRAHTSPRPEPREPDQARSLEEPRFLSRSRPPTGRRILVTPGRGLGILVVLAAVALAAGVLRSQDEPSQTGTETATARDQARAREDSILNLIRPAGLAARILRVMERADADVAAALGQRAARDSLPPAPPDAWLEGAYLAEASAYPEVPRYWTDLERWVGGLRSELPVLVREKYGARLSEGGFAGRTGELLLEEAMEDFRARGDRRDAAFGPMEELIQGSLDLHELLVRREAEIDYDPFSRDRISRDPILEAVAASPELEEEIWANLTRITDALEAMESLESPTTDRLQGWLVGRLRASLGSPGGGEVPGGMGSG